MAEFPIVPAKTAMLFFDALNVYLHPKDPERQGSANEVIKTMVRINEACRKAGIAIFYGQADHRPDGKDFVPLIVEKEIRGRKPVAAFKTVAPLMVAGSWEHERGAGRGRCRRSIGPRERGGGRSRRPVHR